MIKFVYVVDEVVTLFFLILIFYFQLETGQGPANYDSSQFATNATLPLGAIDFLEGVRKYPAALFPAYDNVRVVSSLVRYSIFVFRFWRGWLCHHGRNYVVWLISYHFHKVAWTNVLIEPNCCQLTVD